MKKILLILISAILLVSCKTSEKSPGVHNSGVRPDDPERVAKIPLLISESEKRNSIARMNAHKGGGNNGNGNGGGKPPKPPGKPPKPPTNPPPTPDTTRPIVVITSPAEGDELNLGQVQVKADASDNIGVASVAFSVNGNIRETLTSSPYNFSWTIDSSQAGTSPTISVTALDAAGNSDSYTIVVQIATPPPPVVIGPPPGTSSLLLAVPPAENQGYEGACVAFGGFAMRSIEQYYRTNATSYSYSTNEFSPEFLYDYSRTLDCGGGTAMSLVCDVLVNKGACLWSSLPWSDLNGCDSSIAAPFLGEAAVYKIPSYSKILSSDSAMIKAMLAAHHPVLFSIAGQPVPDPTTFIVISVTGAAGHSMIFTGFDDSKNAYRVLNSWGPDWADHGACWLDYNFFLTVTGYYCYVLNY